MLMHSHAPMAVDDVFKFVDASELQPMARKGKHEKQGSRPRMWLGSGTDLHVSHTDLGSDQTAQPSIATKGILICDLVQPLFGTTKHKKVKEK